MTNEYRSRMDHRFCCHFLIDPPSAGAWNMALDEALLERAAAGDRAVWLRFYQWREPTLSLGYFQSFAAWQSHVSRGCAVVRRQTGGGAILHDRELTYSLVLPRTHPAVRGAESLYARVHEALIAALGGFAVSAVLSGGHESPTKDHADPFLCFERRSPLDVVIRKGPSRHARPDGADATEIAPADCRTVKICGSAQRRRKGAVLMHGSLLLASSDFAPQIKGIKEVTGALLSVWDIRRAWSEQLLAALDLQPCGDVGLPTRVRLAAGQLAESKYSSLGWTRKR